MTKWVRLTMTGIQSIHDTFGRLRSVGAAIRLFGDREPTVSLLDYVQTIVEDDALWRGLPDTIDNIRTVGMRADLEGVLSEFQRPVSPEDY